jgi:hypothetical protein
MDELVDLIGDSGTVQQFFVDRGMMTRRNELLHLAERKWCIC